MNKLLPLFLAPVLWGQNPTVTPLDTLQFATPTAIRVNFSLVLGAQATAPSTINANFSMPLGTVTAITPSLGSASILAQKQLTCEPFNTSSSRMSCHVLTPTGQTALPLASGTIANFSVTCAPNSNILNIIPTLTEVLAYDVSGNPVPVTLYATTPLAPPLSPTPAVPTQYAEYVSLSGLTAGSALTYQTLHTPVLNSFILVIYQVAYLAPPPVAAYPAVAPSPTFLNLTLDTPPIGGQFLSTDRLLILYWSTN